MQKSSTGSELNMKLKKQNVAEVEQVAFEEEKA